jgi:hypothetical protein
MLGNESVGQICADYFSKTIIQSKQEQKSHVHHTSEQILR